MGENLCFATPEEIAANPALRAQIHPGDTVMHYLNRDPEASPRWPRGLRRGADQAGGARRLSVA